MCCTHLFITILFMGLKYLESLVPHYIFKSVQPRAIDCTNIQKNESIEIIFVALRDVANAASYSVVDLHVC